jgi:hypothetical protein
MRFLKDSETADRDMDIFRAMRYNKRASALIMIEMSFFSPLVGQPKNMTDYTIAAQRLWYNKQSRFPLPPARAAIPGVQIARKETQQP